MNDLTVSIVIPVYNEAAYLPACLESIARQTIKPFEVIVIDNNSTDESVYIARQFQFVKVITAEQQGIVHARNLGFNSAQGNIIGRIDADTRLTPTWTANVIRAFQSQPDIAAITGKCTFYDVPFARLTSAVHARVYYHIQKLIAGTEILWGSNMAISKTVWQKVRADCSERTDIPEDIDLSLILKKYGKNIVRTDSVRASVSLRRGRLNPYDVATYLRWWPRIYRVHHAYFVCLLIWLLYIGACVMAAVFWLPNWIMLRFARR